MGAMLGVGLTPSITTSTGALALSALSLMFLSSFGIFRRLAYEVFIALHIVLGIVLLAALCVHRPMYRAWAWSGFVIWGFDRLVSLAKLGWASKGTAKAVVEVLGSDVVRVTVRTGMKWTPGQHAFLTLPSVAPAQQHPFTMTNLSSGEAIFLIRAHKGFTRKLLQHPGEQACLIDGPYGIPPPLSHYASVTLVAGGTGISYCLSLLLGLIREAREGNSAVASVHLVWNTRDEDPVSWIESLVQGEVAKGAGGLVVRIDVHRTRRDSETATPSVNSDEKDGQEKEVSPPSTIQVVEGRADVEVSIRRNVATTPNDAGGMAVIVCGPSSLGLETRRAVCAVNTPSAVARGQVPIHFYSEQFGW